MLAAARRFLIRIPEYVALKVSYSFSDRLASDKRLRRGDKVLRSFLRLFNKHQSVDVTDAMAQEAAFNPALARRLRETEIELVQALQMAENLRLENDRLEQVLRGLNLPSRMPDILEPVGGPMEPILREEETSL